ncbi:F-box domain-containing protein [Favolaschia claudopus]|uniref:F-box domain-containing protein n=1 Tax=Favolaschia claudopus TaxID=2862362 RepID=A0AAW0B0U7_9AGAR
MAKASVAHDAHVAEPEAQNTFLTLNGFESKHYPVLTLPPEIVSEIFLRCIPPYPLYPPFAGPGSPTILTHICRQWREIALSTPHLWRAIAFPGSAMRMPLDDPLLSDLLSRSGSCRLALKLIAIPSESQWAVMGAHCARLEFLKYMVMTTTIYPPYGVGTPMPHLRELNIWLDEDLDSDGAKIAWELPLLHSAILNDFAAQCLILPWAQLTVLGLVRVYLSECTPVLKQTPNLEVCELELYFDLEVGNLSSVTLPRLKALVFKAPNSNVPSTAEHVREVLWVFITPALRILRIPERFLGPTPQSSLASFMTDSGCSSLQTVCITGFRKRVPSTLYQEALPRTVAVSFEDMP